MFTHSSTVCYGSTMYRTLCSLPRVQQMSPGTRHCCYHHGFLGRTLKAASEDRLCEGQAQAFARPGLGSLRLTVLILGIRGALTRWRTATSWAPTDGQMPRARRICRHSNPELPILKFPSYTAEPSQVSSSLSIALTVLSGFQLLLFRVLTPNSRALSQRD